MYMNNIAKILSESMGEDRNPLSEEAEIGAEDLMRRIEAQEMRLEILPNNYTQFTGDLEERDFLSFSQFVHSVYGKRVIKMLEEEDER